MIFDRFPHIFDNFLEFLSELSTHKAVNDKVDGWINDQKQVMRMRQKVDGNRYMISPQIITEFVVLKKSFFWQCQFINTKDESVNMTNEKDKDDSNKDSRRFFFAFSYVLCSTDTNLEYKNECIKYSKCQEHV